MARGLPLEGDRAAEQRALDYADRDVVTCRLSDPVGPLRARVAESPYGFALALGEHDVLLGRLRRAVLEGDAAARAADVMEPGPSTHRPNTAPAKLLEKLEQGDLTTALLTDPDGRFLGIVRRQQLSSER